MPSAEIYDFLNASMNVIIPEMMSRKNKQRTKGSEI